MAKMTADEIRALWFGGAMRLLNQYAVLCRLRATGQQTARLAIRIILEAEIDRYRN